ncbi:MerR family transcriptional regulator [Rhizobium helianthi]|uniref:MerR family transcriptional regulator n=1 Tax=Rhizobium helianthi TaxID=1132695 RepID=A0ABW4M6F5_9HYPH
MTDLLSLAETLKHSGLTKLVLHAWERRYGLEPEQRTETGRRLYTFEQAERLRLLKLCTDAGYRIGNIVSLSLAQLQGLKAGVQIQQTLEPAIAAVKAMEFQHLDRWLHDRADRYDAEDFIDKIVSPLQNAIGDLWADGEVSIAAEHYASAALKRILNGMLEEVSPALADAPVLVATTPEGESHEIGALCVALVARLAGWNVLYLGPDLPPSEVVEASLACAARCVCLSGLCIKPKAAERQIYEIRAKLPARVAVWIGGAGLAGLQPIRDVRFFSDLASFRQALHEE